MTTGEEPRVYLLDMDLRPADTLSVEIAPGAEIRLAQFAADGASLVLVAGRAEGGSWDLIRLRRSDGAVLDRTPLSFVPRSVEPLNDSRTLLLAGTAAPEGPGIVQFLRHYPLTERRRLDSCSDPLQTAMMRHGERVYVLCGTDRISEIDTELGIAVNTGDLSPLVPDDSVPARQCGAADAALSRSQTIIFVTCSISGELLYLDRVTLKPLFAVQMNHGPTRVAVSPDGSTALVLLKESGRLARVDLGARTVTASYLPPPPARPLDVTFSAGDRWAYVTAWSGDGQGIITRLDLESGTFDATLAVPGTPSAVTVWPGRRLPFLAWTD